jgi:hypothetical protein
MPPGPEVLLGAWIEACRTAPGVLPPDLEPVQTRLVRAVGRGELPGAGPVYLKTMGFPRGKDRLRYVHRALPAAHEARMLELAAAAGVAVPEVLAVHAERSHGLPLVSVLVTRALPVSPAGPPIALAEAAGAAARLAARGVFHPDLHRGNFLRLDGGALGLVDFQSARRRRAPLRPALRVRMAAKLAVEFAAEGAIDELAAAALVRAADLPAVARLATALRERQLDRRVRRCLSTSTEFVSERRTGGRLYRRRACALEGGRWLPRADAYRLWLGDRACEVLDRASPVLGALFRKSWWRRGDDCVYIPGGDDQRFSSEHAPRLEGGYRRLRELAAGRRAP